MAPRTSTSPNRLAPAKSLDAAVARSCRRQVSIAARISIRPEALSPFRSPAASGVDGEVRCEVPAAASALFLHAAKQQARARANETRHDGDPTRWRPDTMAKRQFHLSWFLSQ